MDIDYKIFLQNDNPDEAIFAILADYGNEKPEIIVNHIIQRIQTKNNTTLEQQKCYEQLRTLANLRNLQPLINLIMQSISQFFNKDIDPWYNEGHKKGHTDGLQKGIQKGIEQGIQEGRQEGRQEAVSEKNQQFTITLLQNTDFDNDKIATLVGVSVAYVTEIRTSLKNN